MTFLKALALSFFGSAMVLAIAGIGLAMALTQSPPDVYENSFFQMVLEPGWSCEPAGTETICYPGTARPSPAIAIMAMKYRGPHDTLVAYEQHLRQPKINERFDKPSRSVVNFVRRKRIAGHEWVESLHFESEVRNYYTYYLAAATSHTGILVTLSAHKNAFENHRASFERMIASLVIHQN